MGWEERNVGSPGFVVDINSIDRNTGRQIDWNVVPDSYKAGVRYTITAPDGAAQGATSIGVTALTVALPLGTMLKFGTAEFAQLTQYAEVGAEDIYVEALPNAIESGDTAPYLLSESNEKVIPAGTVMCELANGKIVPRAARPGSEQAIGILWSTASQHSKVAAKTGHGVIVGGVIFENLLPETITSYKTELETNGTSWVWETYADSSEV